MFMFLCIVLPPSSTGRKIWKISQARIQYLQELDMPDSNFEEEKKKRSVSIIDRSQIIGSPDWL